MLSRGRMFLAIECFVPSGLVDLFHVRKSLESGVVIMGRFSVGKGGACSMF